MSARLRTAAAVTCLAAVLAASGCGSKKDEGDPLPSSVVASLKQELDSVQRRIEFADAHRTSAGVGACNDIQDDSFPSIAQSLDRVPDSVGADVRDALNKSFDHLLELTRSTCDKVKSDSEETDTNTDTTPTETIAPTPTETTPTETTPTQTTTTPEKKKPKIPTPKTPKTPSQNPGGTGDQGGGNGGQGGGAGAPSGGGP